ncbi:gustatory receptor 77a [Cochliomyia hominivorax]
MGIACFSYDFQQYQAKESWQTRFYTICLLLVTLAFMPFAIYILYTEMTFLRQNQLLTYVGYIRYGLMLICAWVALYLQLHYRNAIMECFNKMLKLRHYLELHLNHLDNDDSGDWRSHRRVIWNIMAKCLTIMLQFLWIIFLILNDKGSKRFWYLLTLMYVQYCQLILVATLNLLYYGSWLVALITQELNHNLEKCLKQIKSVTYHRTGYHRFHISSLCQQLEQMLQHHWKLYKLSRTFLHLYSWQIVCFLTFVINECVTQIFIMYFVAVDILSGRHELRHAVVGTVASVYKDSHLRALKREFNEDGAEEEGKEVKLRAIINPYALLYVFGIIWDMILILLMINEMRLSFSKTRFIFSNVLWLKTLLSSANQELDKCLSHFNLYLLYLQPCITYSAYGLFTFDKNLILRLLESMFLYLLLLIQFDIIIN